MKVPATLKQWIPPILLNLYRERIKGGSGFTGNYTSWLEASGDASGYDADVILKKVETALLQVKNGRAAYERDSVLFEQMEYPFPLLAVLLQVALNNEAHLHVLDFGGSLGSTYFQCRDFLYAVKHLQWCIVEQEQFVQRGRALFETEELHFHYSISDCIKLFQPDVVLLSSVIQYVQKPYELLEIVQNTDAPYLVIDRTPFSRADQDRLCVQHVTPPIYSASYPCWILSESKVESVLNQHYRLVAAFISPEGHAKVDGLPFAFKGMIWKKP